MLISIDHLFDSADDQALMAMLVDDTLTLKCDIDVFVGVKSSPGRELTPAALFKDELVEYLKSDVSKDVCLKVGSSTFSINKTLLAARSTVGSISG